MEASAEGLAAVVRRLDELEHATYALRCADEASGTKLYGLERDVGAHREEFRLLRASLEETQRRVTSIEEARELLERVQEAIERSNQLTARALELVDELRAARGSRD